MKMLFKGALIAAIATALAPAGESLAQPAEALGHPLPGPDLPTGTISVRVIAGSPQAAVTGVDVTLLVGGAPKTARTDSTGRAVFNNLTPGTTVQAKILDAEQKELSSDAFPVPSSGGAKVMLSTKPFVGGGGGMGGAPFAGGGGGGGMPEPRKISGTPRPDKDTPGASYVVRLTYNDLAAKPGDPKGPPVGETVTLVGYAADDSVSVRTAKSDEQGRAMFDNLDPSGSTGYFALVSLPRGTGVDRLYSLPSQMDSAAGVRVILSGEKRDSGLPNIDQYATAQTIPTPPGKVRVTLEGLGTTDGVIRVVDASTHAVVGQVKAATMDADPTTVQGGSKFDGVVKMPANTLDVTVHGGPNMDAPLPDVELRIVAADATQLDGESVKTGADGKAHLVAKPAADGKQQRAVFKILGRDFVSEPFDLSKTGGTLDVTAKWAAAGGRPQGVLDIPYTPGQVLYAEATVTGKLAGTYRSIPFIATEAAGTHVGVIVYPRLIMKFTMRASIEDQLLAVQGRWQIENNSWIPYRAGDDGLLIPAPAGFKGGVVADMNQADVAVVPTEGFRVIRPLPPGSGRTFVAGFSLPVDGGVAEWALDLPLGTVGSELSIKRMQGMHVDTRGGAVGKDVEGKDGETYYRIDSITIGRNKSMQMSISGLPAPAGWKIWAPRVIGVAVVLIILGGLGIALFWRNQAEPAAVDLARKNALLEELVELERSGANNARREQLVAELEKIWG